MFRVTTYLLLLVALLIDCTNELYKCFDYHIRFVNFLTDCLYECNTVVTDGNE